MQRKGVKKWGAGVKRGLAITPPYLIDNDGACSNCSVMIPAVTPTKT